MAEHYNSDKAKDVRTALHTVRNSAVSLHDPSALKAGDTLYGNLDTLNKIPGSGYIVGPSDIPVKAISDYSGVVHTVLIQDAVLISGGGRSEGSVMLIPRISNEELEAMRKEYEAKLAEKERLFGSNGSKKK